ncbi:hypothetical protein RB595_002121 [Gaeumannomyces hyphopodioides]
MHFHNAVLVVLAGMAPLLARADDDLELDNDDIPQQCRGICNPVKRLTDICDVDDDRINDDRVEELLNLQCVCTNRSFDVARFAALCQSCMTQNNPRDKDDLKDINKIMSKCGFAAQTYSSSQSNDANGINVSAVKPTAASQLTTTFAPGSAATQPPASGTTARSGNPSTTSSTGGSGQQSPATTSAGGNSNPARGSATSAAIPMVGLAIAAVFGSVLML